MSAKIEFTSYINQAAEKYPDIPKESISDILKNAPQYNLLEGYEPAFLVEKKLGLKSRYFSKAFRSETEIKAQIIKHYDHIYVRLDDEIIKLLEQGYICQTIKQSESKDYAKTIRFTKNTSLGFYI